jgi:hypothetical protein
MEIAHFIKQQMKNLKATLGSVKIQEIETKEEKELILEEQTELDKLIRDTSVITECEYQIAFISSKKLDYVNKIENLMKQSKLPENTK